MWGDSGAVASTTGVPPSCGSGIAEMFSYVCGDGASIRSPGRGNHSILTSRTLTHPLRSALALLVTRVLADDHDVTVATDYLALVADRLDARVDFHCDSLVSLSSYPEGAPGRYFPAVP